MCLCARVVIPSFFLDASVRTSWCKLGAPVRVTQENGQRIHWYGNVFTEVSEGNVLHTAGTRSTAAAVRAYEVMSNL